MRPSDLQLMRRDAAEEQEERARYVTKRCPGCHSTSLRVDIPTPMHQNDVEGTFEIEDNDATRCPVIEIPGECPAECMDCHWVGTFSELGTVTT